MQGRLADTTAIVTGASSGIGAATARMLAAEGARVIGGARRVERLETDVALALDVTDPESCERFVEAAGPVDILVNAAGLALGRVPVDESSEEDEKTVIETNVNGLIRMTRLVLQRSLREPGHIVNMGSIAGPLGVSVRRELHRGQVRRPRLHPRAARGSARTRHPRHDRRCGARRDRVLTRPLQRRRREGCRGLRGNQAALGRRRGRLHPVRSHPAGPRGGRRARPDVDRPVERRPHPPAQRFLVGSQLAALHPVATKP